MRDTSNHYGKSRIGNHSFTIYASKMVRAVMIVEMAGRPAEHLVDSLQKHVEILREVSDITVHGINLSEAKEIERPADVKGPAMFTAFAECDFECENFARLSETMFDFMPSSVEVIEPGKVSMDMAEATNLLNNISGRLHRYDDVAKMIGQKYKQLEMVAGKMQNMLKEKDAEIEKLSKGKVKKVASRTKSKKKPTSTKVKKKK